MSQGSTTLQGGVVTEACFWPGPGDAAGWLSRAGGAPAPAPLAAAKTEAELWPRGS